MLSSTRKRRTESKQWQVWLTLSVLLNADTTTTQIQELTTKHKCSKDQQYHRVQLSFQPRNASVHCGPVSTCVQTEKYNSYTDLRTPQLLTQLPTWQSQKPGAKGVGEGSRDIFTHRHAGLNEFLQLEDNDYRKLFGISLFFFKI